MCPLESDTFATDWPEALEFIRERLAVSREFKVEIEENDT
jgi:hypothetical protein